MKKIINRIWLPVITVLIIGVGVIVLAGAMRVSQTHETGQTVMKPAVAATPDHVSSENADAAVQYSETATAELEHDTASAETQRIQIPALPDGYKVIPTLNEAGDTPGEDELSYNQAGAIAVTMLTKVFGEAFTQGSTDIYVNYRNNEGMFNNQFEFYMGSDNDSKASFTGYMDSVSGRDIHIENHTPAAKDKNPSPEEDVSKRLFALYDDEKIPEVARKLINEQFADGRTIETIIVDGIQVGFTPGVDIVADCKVGLGKGDCYLVRVGYPTYDVRMFEIHPVG